MHSLKVLTLACLLASPVGCAEEGEPQPATTSAGADTGNNASVVAGSGGQRTNGGSAAGAASGSGGSAGAVCPTLSGMPPLFPPGGLSSWKQLEPVEASTCSVPPGNLPDQCGCDGLSCSVGESCQHVSQPLPNGPPTSNNVCFVLCKNDDDCTTPQVCVGDVHGLLVCKQVECRGSSDCNDRACGACVDGYVTGHAGAVYADPSAKRCVYP